MITIRPALESDQSHLVDWLSQPGVLAGFPLFDLREIEDAARICLGYIKQNAVLTALHDGEPCGIANLYLQPYKKIAHQCLFMIVIDEKHRGQGIGTQLLTALIELAKERHIELLHLEVYEGNAAIRLYQRCGFEEYGRHPRFIKDDGRYITKILMQKRLSL